MSNLKLSLSLLIVALGIFNVAAHKEKDKIEPEIIFYELKKGNLQVNFTNFGARIVSLIVPDKFGNQSDIVLGYDTVDEYKADKNFFGAIVGRVANRIGGGNFNLNNTHYYLNINDGTNTLNGESVGFANVIWNVKKYEKSEENPSITFQYNSTDNDQGFPGNLLVTATYILQNKNKLKIKLRAKAEDKATPVNLAQHTYFNLGGHNSSYNILHDQLQILSSNFTELDPELVPTGKLLPVNDTPYDFLNSHAIQSRFQKLKDGYEMNYVLDKRENNKKNDDDGDEVKLAAILRDNKSGRVLKLWTDEPVVVFGSGDKLSNVKGKGGILYGRNQGLVLAAQGYPDAVNHGESFGSQIVEKGKTYKQTTLFEFSVKA